MKQRIPAIMAAFALLLTGCSNAETTVMDTPIPLTVTFLKVGKADGIVIRTDAHTVVIDCGEKSDGSKMVNFLTENGVESIDYMILTHYDQDHIGGAAKVLKNFPAAHVIGADYTEQSDAYEKLVQTMQTLHISLEMPSEPMSFRLADVDFTVYPHIASDYQNGFDNNCSLVTKISHHNNTLLLTGDAMQERLKEIMDIGDCDLLKVPYHGREIPNLPDFLDAVTPEYAVISTSAKELSDAAMQALADRSIQTYVTCNDGNITAVSDGERLQITASGLTE